MAIVPHFYFDLDDNGRLAPDPDGLPLASLEEARTQAITALAEMARDHKPIADERALSITVRDGDGPLYRVDMMTRCVPVRG